MLTNQQWQLVAQASGLAGRSSGKENTGGKIMIATKNSGVVDIIISGKGLNGAECSITDLNGKRLHTETLRAGLAVESSFKLNVDIPKGTYIVMIRSGTWNDSRKVIFQ